MYATNFDSLKAMRDTRPAHRQMFTGLTPPLNPKYAGNYRGSTVDPCLEDKKVWIPADPMVGSLPKDVATHMQELSSVMAEAIVELDGKYNKMALDEFSNHLIVLGCISLELFLRIHPYVNGNGHIGRYILTVMFKRYGFRFTDAYPIDPKPMDRHRYSNCLSQHRRGVTDPLHTYIAECIDRSPGPARVNPALLGAA